MSPAPRHGAAVPMFLCGAYAREFADLLLAYGMNLEVISERIGAASAVKMCRSVVVRTRSVDARMRWAAFLTGPTSASSPRSTRRFREWIGRSSRVT